MPSGLQQRVQKTLSARRRVLERFGDTGMCCRSCVCIKFVFFVLSCSIFVVRVLSFLPLFAHICGAFLSPFSAESLSRVEQLQEELKTLSLSRTSSLPAGALVTGERSGGEGSSLAGETVRSLEGLNNMDHLMQLQKSASAVKLQRPLNAKERRRKEVPTPNTMKPLPFLYHYHCRCPLLQSLQRHHLLPPINNTPIPSLP